MNAHMRVAVRMRWWVWPLVSWVRVVVAFVGIVTPRDWHRRIAHAFADRLSAFIKQYGLAVR